MIIGDGKKQRALNPLRRWLERVKKVSNFRVVFVTTFTSPSSKDLLHMGSSAVNSIWP